MRPILKPGLRVIARDHETLQIGVDPRRAVLVTGAGGVGAALLEALDGTRDLDGLAAWASARGLPTDETVALIRSLDEHGLVQDAGAEPALARRDHVTRQRLGPDSDALGVLGPPSSHGRGSALQQRHAAYVVIEGGGRLGAAVAHLVAAAGVGRVDVVDPAVVDVVDVSPAGHRLESVGRSRSEAVGEALSSWGARSGRPSPTTTRRRAARAGRSDPAASSGPDLVILTTAASRSADRRTELLRSGVPHLAASVRETVAEVGPLVLPGTSACIGCVDLHRSDRDPGWPRVVHHLANRDDVGETLLVSMAAALCAVSATAFLDGREGSPVVDGSVDITLPFGEVIRRTWLPHPACGCTWDGSSTESSSIRSRAAQ